MASDTTGGAASGAAQGAAAGAAFGPWGAVIGAVVGGVLGYFSGGKKKLAKKYAAKAAEQKRAQQTMKLAIARRDLIRSQRGARAQAISAGTADAGVTSTSVQGATSSIDMQGNSALNYFDAQVSSDNLYQTYSKKAGKYAQDAQQLDSLLGAASDLGAAAGDVYGMNKTGSGGGASSGGGYSSTYTMDTPNTTNPYKTFGSTIQLG